MLDAHLRARIQYRLRRGMLELDALLHGFFQDQFASLSQERQAQFAEILELEDPHLYQMFIGVQDAPTPELTPLIENIRDYWQGAKEL